MSFLRGFRNPHNLPVKTCAHCERPFSWRRKWARSWNEVKYCSKACSQQGARKPPANLCAAGSVEDEF